MDIQEKEVHIHLDEKAIKPEGYEIVDLISKGFHQASIVQDFPLRDKAMYLHVRRRRWYCEPTKKTSGEGLEYCCKRNSFNERICNFFKRCFWIPTQSAVIAWKSSITMTGINLVNSTKSI